jgi:hypothetical protein
VAPPHYRRRRPSDTRPRPLSLAGAKKASAGAGFDCPRRPKPVAR